MTSSTDSDRDRYLKDLLGYEGDSVEISLEKEDAVESALESPIDGGNITAADFSKKPNFNLLAVGGLAALIVIFLGFFTFNRPAEEKPDESPEQSEESEVLEGPADSRIGQLKTQVALSEQEAAMKDRGSPVDLQERPEAPPPRQSPPRVSTASPPTPEPIPPPPRPAVRPTPLPAARRAASRSFEEVPPPLAIRQPRTAPFPSRHPAAREGTPMTATSYQFGFPDASPVGTAASRDAESPLEVPRNYRAYYPQGAIAGEGVGPYAPAEIPSIPSPMPSPAALVASTAPLELTPAERQFLEGRPRTRVVPVGTRILARIFQSTAVDGAGGNKILLQVSKPLLDNGGGEIVPAGTLIGATLQVGSGGVARVEPEVIYFKERPYPLPAHSAVVALRDGHPLVAERIERGGSGGGVAPLGLVADTAATFLPMLGGSGSDSFRDFYQFQRLSDYTQRNFGGNTPRPGGYPSQSNQPSVYFKLPPDLDVQLLVVAPLELPL